MLKILKYPDPTLREICDPVADFDAELSKLIDNMFLTMYEANGAGLAAPQVGILKRLTVIDVSKDNSQKIELINPEVISEEGKASNDEACLSIPGYSGVVSRSEAIVVRARDRKGEEFELEAEGLLAICIQHEIDHLNGVLYIDHLSRLKRQFFKSWFKKNADKFE